MIKKRMLELILLNQFQDWLSTLKQSTRESIIENLDINKMIERSSILTEEFLKDYVKDNGVTA